MSEHTRDEEIEMMSHPDRWPHTTVLPLTRRVSGQDRKEEGFLWQPSMRTPCPAPEPVVYLGNIFASGRVSEKPKIPYASISAIADAGWEVD